MKEDKSFSFNLIDVKSYNPYLSEEKKTSGKDFISWGADNLYSYYLYDIYSNCATLQAIINGCSDYTFGDGINFNINIPSLNWENSKGDTLEEVIQKLILDRWIFGGFAFQVLYNKFHQITEIIYLDFRKCRTNEEGTEIYYSDYWGKYGQGTRTEKYPCFDLSNEEQFNQIYYYKGNKTRGVYPVPDYNASLVSAETQIQIQKFHYNTIINNFMVNGMLSISGAGYDDNQKQQINDDINRKFSGADNAGTLMVAFPDAGSEVSFERISSDDFDKKYDQLAESTRENLFISMRAMPQLFGLNYEAGFSAVEYQDAFALFNKVSINPVQKELTRVFDKVFGNENSVTFIPFTIEFADSEEREVVRINES